MALSEDSRTLLQLLLGRGKSYNDISGLLGIDEAEVRDRAHQALTEINGSDPDVDVNLTDYLLGQSDPIGRADVARELARNEEAADTASSLSDQLRLLVPGANLPRPDGSGGSVTTKSSARGSTSKSSSRSRKSDDDGGSGRSPLSKTHLRLIAALVLLAILVVVGIILIAGGSDDDPAEVQQAGADAAVSVLQPVGNQEGNGRVQFGQAEDQFAARLTFTELEPTNNDSSYVLWTVGSVGAFPLNETVVKQNGQINQTILIPAVVFCSIASDVFTDMRLSKLTGAERKKVLADTEKAVDGGNQNKLPDYAGNTVFEGPIAMEQSLKATVQQSCSAPTNTTGGQSAN
ncbi:MAG: hypothetical protein WBP55_01045 [Solirubrobacterales bacterium]